MEKNLSHNSKINITSSFSTYHKILIGFLPPLALIIFLIGKPIIITLAIGGILAWMFDISQLPSWIHLGNTTFWVAMVNFQILFYFLPLIKTDLYYLFLLVHFWFLLAIFAYFLGLPLIGSNFTNALPLNPIIRAFENIIVFCLPICSSVVLTWFYITYSGAKNAGFFCFMFYFVYYIVFGVDLQSQYFKHHLVFQPGSGLNYPELEKALLTLFMWIIPTSVHIGVYHKVLFNSGSDILTLIGLFSLPGVALKLVSSSNPYSWLSNHINTNEKTKTKKTNITDQIFIISMVGLIAFLENRVIFSFMSSFITLFPPWSYIFMTLMLYSLFCLILLHVYGFFENQNSKFGSQIFLALISLTAFSLSISFGLPLWLYPVMITAGVSLQLIYFKNYGEWLFLGSFGLCLFWFVKKTLWFLDFQLNAASLQLISLGLVIFVLLTFYLPIALNREVKRKSKSTSTLEIALLIHSILLYTLEFNLYRSNRFGKDIYSFSAVIFTSILSLFLLFRIQKLQLFTNQIFKWIIFSLYFSKLLFIFSPMRWLWLFAPSFTLAFSHIFFLEKNQENFQEKKEVVFGHVLIIAFLLYFPGSRFIERVLLMLYNIPPTSGTILGINLIILAFYSIFLFIKRLPNFFVARNFSMILFCLGTLILLFRPEVRIIDFSRPTIFSTSWPQWFLILGIFSTAFISFKLTKFRQSSFMRQFYSFIMGISIGLYLIGFYFPNEIPFVVSILFINSCILLFYILVFSKWPSVSSQSLIPYLYILFQLLFLIIYVTLKVSFPYGSKSNILRSCLILLLGFYVLSNILIASLMKFLQPVEEESGWKTKKHNYTPYSKKIQLHLDYTPHIGNFSCILAVLQSHFLNMWFLSGSSLGILFYGPLLLFLNKETLLFTKLSPEKRYFPLLFAISFVLIASSLRMVLFPSSAELFASDLIETPTFFWTLKNFSALCFTLPALFIISKVSWTRRYQSGFLWLLVTPINIFPLFFSNLPPVRVLAFINLLGVIIVHLFDSDIVKTFVFALLDDK